MIRYYVIGAGGEILRRGACIDADGPMQGEVVVLRPLTDPEYPDDLFRYDAATDSFVALDIAGG